MRFNIPTPGPTDDDTPAVGNVYRCKGGGKTDYWIIIGIDERTVNLLGINRAGSVTSTANYGIHVFTSPNFNRKLIGRCEGLDDLEFDVVWTDASEGANG